MPTLPRCQHYLGANTTFGQHYLGVLSLCQHHLCANTTFEPTSPLCPHHLCAYTTFVPTPPLRLHHLVLTPISCLHPLCDNTTLQHFSAQQVCMDLSVRASAQDVLVELEENFGDKVSFHRRLLTTDSLETRHPHP